MRDERNMKHYIFGGALALAACGMAVAAVVDGDRSSSRVTIKGSGDQITETRDLPPFDRVILRGAADLELTAGTDQRVEISTDPQVMEILTTTVENGTLTIEFDRKVRMRDVDIDLRIGMATLSALIIDGAADGELMNINSEALTLTINGAADLSADGTCGSLALQINGAGDIEADDLRCANATVTINGAGDASVYASESVEIAINGVGDVDVSGSPDKVVRKSAGLGSIEIN